ncbi:CGNR zinc finger domain-containing protein [Pseudoclavibacter terrae]|uniref:CGNR zinc finger domain-containing protein n=1 Tax=Pseudoclavibacter terrae TaxID=1530195 RepID=A0A7J5AY40_9MICO|nr:CGNR zinc finger domain-containing protein [Pseudoclavibacter terrae]KAB1636275.1 CGNR zinc finger domain-containing protein [Pseudoclavibacter terrae]
MLFTNDTEEALAAAAALVNSDIDPLTLQTRAELADFFRDRGYTGRFDGDDAEFKRVRAIRPKLRELLTADRDLAASLVNQTLTEYNATPQLVRHDTHDWHLHAVDADRPLDERISVETALAVVDVIRSDEMSRLGTCDADGCDGVVVDLTRNRTKRFCSTRCANRTAVAAYRARRREHPDT